MARAHSADRKHAARRGAARRGARREYRGARRRRRACGLVRHRGRGRRCARWWMRSPALTRSPQDRRVPGSSRALGWDTMLPTSSCGTKMSAGAIGHTGFTGTSLWIDRRRTVGGDLVEPRAPTRAGRRNPEIRRALHDAIVTDLGGRWPGDRDAWGWERSRIGAPGSAGQTRAAASAAALAVRPRHATRFA